jgi:hypothetical protein
MDWAPRIVAVEALHGLSNENVCVSTDEGEFVVRRGNLNAHLLGIDRHAEAEAMAHAQAAEIGPLDLRFFAASAPFAPLARDEPCFTRSMPRSPRGPGTSSSQHGRDPVVRLWHSPWVRAWA